MGFCAGTPRGTASAIFLPGLVVLKLVGFYVLETAVKKRQKYLKKGKNFKLVDFVMISMHDKNMRLKK